MFKNILKISMLIAAFGLMIPSLAFSEKNIEVMKELRLEIKDYKYNNIIPKFNDWKKDIDQNLKKEDFEKLNNLRNKVSEIRKQKRDDIKSIAENSKFNKTEKKDKIKEISKSMRNELKEVGLELKPIAMNNIDLIKKIGESAKPFAEKWQTDIKTMIDDWKAKNKEIIEKSEKQGKGNRGDFTLKGFGNHGDKNDKYKGKRFMAMVMLYNGESDNDEEDLLGPELMKEFESNTSNNVDVKISPNPFAENTKITFELAHASKVKLNISEQTGRIVAELFNGNLGIGNQEFEFKPAVNTSNGIYFYNLEIDGKVFTGKIMYSK